MSEVVKSVFINYVVCAILGGFLEYFAPNKSRKTLRVIIMAIVLVTSFTPLLKSDLSIPDLSGYEELSGINNYDALMHTANLTEKKVYGEIRDILINSGIDEYEIYVATSVEEETSTVWLEGVTVEIPKEFSGKITEIEGLIPEEYRSVTRVGEK